MIATTILYNERFYRQQHQWILPVWQNRIIIDVDAFAHNVSSIKSHVGDKAELVTVVKDDCYGHGAEVLAPIALENGADIVLIASWNEYQTSSAIEPTIEFGDLLLQKTEDWCGRFHAIQ